MGKYMIPHKDFYENPEVNILPPPLNDVAEIDEMDPNKFSYNPSLIYVKHMDKCLYYEDGLMKKDE
jgi:hypothetical protein